MWRQDLEDHGYPTVLLNAWETEWAEDPLIAVIACIIDACKKNQPANNNIDQIKSIIGNFVKKPLPILGSIFSAIIEKQYDIDLSNFSNEVKELNDPFNKEVDSFKERESSIKELKTALEKLAWDVKQGSDSKKPLVFIIDELDRCNPDYAVRMLEVLKHFFEVKNIIFVCSIDKKHLEDSVRGHYGCENLNAKEYLRRFFDLEIELPQPNYATFCAHLFDYYDLKSFFESRGDGEVFQSFLASLAIKSNLTLRQVDRICAFTKLSLQGRGPRSYYYPDLSLFVTYLRFFDPSFYQDLRGHKMTAQELLDRVTSEYGSFIDPETGDYDEGNNHHMMLYMVSRLISSYNYDRGAYAERITNTSENSNPLTCSAFSQKEFNDVINNMHRRNEYKLKWLFGILDILRIDNS